MSLTYVTTKEIFTMLACQYLAHQPAYFSILFGGNLCEQQPVLEDSQTQWNGLPFV